MWYGKENVMSVFDGKEKRWGIVKESYSSLS
jgi:hypothetical protein